MSESDDGVDNLNQAKSFKKPFLNTLFSVLKELEDCITTVELINETKIKGTVEHVSKTMDLTLVTAVIYPVNGRNPKYSAERIVIRRNKVRFIHFPETFNIIMKLQANVRKVKRI